MKQLVACLFRLIKTHVHRCIMGFGVGGVVIFDIGSSLSSCIFMHLENVRVLTDETSGRVFRFVCFEFVGFRVIVKTQMLSLDS